MATKTTEKTSPTADREIVISRVLNATRDLVVKAWTDPQAVMKWWGPRHFTSPACTIDFKVGGKYRFCMRTPEGQDMWSTGTYKEIAPMDKIVCTDSFSDPEGNIVSPAAFGFPADFSEELLITLLLEEKGGKTRMTLIHEGMPAGQMADSTHAGWNESFDKMAGSLKLGPNRLKPDWDLRLQRVFDGPKALLFDVFTKPEHLAHWWGPKGFTLPVCESDFRNGGAFTWVMRAPDGSDHPVRGEFLDIIPGESFRWICRLDDLLPEEHEIAVHITFAEKAGKTEVSLHQTFAKVDTALKEDAKAGWGQSFERIDDYLASRKGK